MPDDFDTEARAAERLTFFSDAVVAIAITLLAIELPVPEGADWSAFWSSVRHNDGHYAAFLISFAVISAAWSTHHELFQYARRIDARLRGLNTVWLFTIVVNPFATKLLTSSGSEALDVHAAQFGFYALLQVAESVVLFTMMKHMISHGQVPGLPRQTVNNMSWQSYNIVLGFGLSIPIFFLTTYGWILWIVLPMVVARLHHLHHRHDHDADPAP